MVEQEGVSSCVPGIPVDPKNRQSLVPQQANDSGEVSGCVPGIPVDPQNRQVTDPRKRVRTLTWNVGSLSSNLPEVTRLLVTYQPHLLFLQEQCILLT